MGASNIAHIDEWRESTVNPQKENGYVGISTEIVEALAASKLLGAQHQCICVILRKTYGWDKKSDAISYSQFEEMTGLDGKTIRRALNRLEEKKLIKVERKGRYKRKRRAKRPYPSEQKGPTPQSKKALPPDGCVKITYCFNKHYDQWSEKKSVQKKSSKGAKRPYTTISSTVLDKYRESYTRACAGENFFCPKCGIIVPGGMEVCPTPNCKLVFDEIWDQDVEVLKWNS